MSSILDPREHLDGLFFAQAASQAGTRGEGKSTNLFLTIPVQIWNPQKPDYSTLLGQGWGVRCPRHLSWGCQKEGLSDLLSLHPQKIIWSLEQPRIQPFSGTENCEQCLLAPFSLLQLWSLILKKGSRDRTTWHCHPGLATPECSTIQNMPSKSLLVLVLREPQNCLEPQCPAAQQSSYHSAEGRWVEKGWLILLFILSFLSNSSLQDNMTCCQKELRTS